MVRIVAIALMCATLSFNLYAAMRDNDGTGAPAPVGRAAHPNYYRDKDIPSPDQEAMLVTAVTDALKQSAVKENTNVTDLDWPLILGVGYMSRRVQKMPPNYFEPSVIAQNLIDELQHEIEDAKEHGNPDALTRKSVLENAKTALEQARDEPQKKKKEGGGCCTVS